MDLLHTEQLKNHFGQFYFTLKKIGIIRKILFYRNAPLFDHVFLFWNVKYSSSKGNGEIRRRVYVYNMYVSAERWIFFLPIQFRLGILNLPEGILTRLSPLAFPNWVRRDRHFCLGWSIHTCRPQKRNHPRLMKQFGAKLDNNEMKTNHVWNVTNYFYIL